MRSREVLIALAVMMVLLALPAIHEVVVPAAPARATFQPFGYAQDRPPTSNPSTILRTGLQRPTDESPCPIFLHDAQHTGLSLYIGPAWPQLRWRYPTSSCAVVESSPAIAEDGTIHIGSFDGYVYAIHPDGSLKWRYKTGSRVYSSPAIAADGTIYVSSRDGYLYAIHPDGSLKWRYENGWKLDSSPAIGEDDTIYVGSYDGYLYAIYPDGSLKWRYETEDYITSSPAIGGDGTVYVGSYDGYLYAIRPDGSLLWRYETEDEVESSPAIGADGTIYVGSGDGYLYAFHPDGSLRWRYENGWAIKSSPAIGADGTIYVGSDDGYLYAIYSDGSLRWRYETEGEVYSSPAIGGDGTIYVGSYDGYLHAIHPDGSLRWRYETAGEVHSSPAIGGDGTIYVGSDDAFLYAIEEGPSPTATPTAPTPTPTPTVTPPLRVNVMPDRDAWVGEPLVVWGNAVGGSAMAESGRVSSAMAGSRVPDRAVTFEPPSGCYAQMDIEATTPYLRLRVNQTHDWADACTSPTATVWITVTDALDSIKGMANGNGGSDGCISAGEFDWDGDRPDIVIGDRVDGSSSDGSTAAATVVNIIGLVDAEANTLSGQVLGVSYPATMRGEIWEEGATWPETQTDDQGYFTLDFNPFDIQPGMDVAAWYIQPDGNWVGAIGSALVYTWTFGDGTDAEIGNVTDARYINTTHTYYAPGTYTAALTVSGGGDTDNDQVAIRVRNRSAVTDTLPIDVNIAIERGLRWLYLNQDEETGAWTPWGYPVAKTSEAVLAFEVQDHLPENDPDCDIYAETVQRGLDYLLAGARTVGIEPQPAGDPDVNGNGFGVAVCGHGGMYEAGMFTSALAGSWAPNQVVASGPLSGWTYAEVMQDAVDFIAYAQTDAGPQRGGWRYSPNSHNSDNSVSQWPVLGLLGARLWEADVTVPAFVTDELELWVEFIQSEDGGSGYIWPGLSNVARTGALLIEMGYVGDDAETPRVQRAIDFLGSHWHDEPGEPPGSAGSGGNKGNLYAMYAVKKGLTVLHADTVPVAGHPEGLDWYRDYATWLVGEQTTDGNWEYNNLSDNTDDYLTTAWALLILEPVIFPPPPTPTPTPTPTATPTATPTPTPTPTATTTATPTPTPTPSPTATATATPTPTPTPTVTATAMPIPTPVVECYCCSPGDSIYRIDVSSFYGYTTTSAKDSPLIRVTSPPAPWGWNQPDFVPDGSWQPGSEVWWTFWADPNWASLPGDCRPIGLQDENGNQEAWDGTTQLYRRTFALSPPEAGMQVRRAVLEMWSDNKTEWWWEGTSISNDRQAYAGQVDLFPAYVGPNGGTYALAIQNSNDYVCSPNCNPQGTACRLCITWAVPSPPGYRVYLPLILKMHP